MTNQHEITKRMPLLNREGNLTEPGWARGLLWDYHRPDIRASGMRIKEWDYYLVVGDACAVAFTLSDDGYVGLQSVSLLELGEHPWEHTETILDAFPMGKFHLPGNSSAGDIVYDKGRLQLSYCLEEIEGKRVRHIRSNFADFYQKKPFSCDIVLEEPDMDTMVIATPWDKDGHFYYNQKINCLRAEGWIELGSRRYELTKDKFFAVLDWGRGVWTYHNTWYWGSASGELDGIPFGWNIGYGFGDTSAATENVLFYDGKIHKLGEVKFEIPMDEDGFEDFMKPWVFTSDDNRFYMNFTPVLDRSAFMSAGVVLSDQHQVFGHFTGRITLDDGTVLPVRDFFGFAEKVENKW